MWLFQIFQDRISKNHSDRRISQFELAQLVRIALEKRANGFKKCGMFPYNGDVFSSLNFAPTEVHYILQIGNPKEAVLTSTAICNPKSCYKSSETDVSTQPEPGPSDIYYSTCTPCMLDQLHPNHQRLIFLYRQMTFYQYLRQYRSQKPQKK